MDIEGTWQFPESLSELRLLQARETSGEIRILDTTQAGWHAPQGGVLVQVLTEPVRPAPRNRWFGALRSH